AVAARGRGARGRAAPRAGAPRPRCRIALEEPPQPIPLPCELLLLATELALHDGEHVRRHQRVEAAPPFQRRDEIVLEKPPHGAEQLGHRRPILHRQAPPSIRSSSSSSISHVRRPRLASSTLRTPPRKVWACMSVMIPQRRLPNTSHQRTTAGSIGAPPARS